MGSVHICCVGESSVADLFAAESIMQHLSGVEVDVRDAVVQGSNGSVSVMLRSCPPPQTPDGIAVHGRDLPSEHSCTAVAHCVLREPHVVSSAGYAKGVQSVGSFLSVRRRKKGSGTIDLRNRWLRPFSIGQIDGLFSEVMSAERVITYPSSPAVTVMLSIGLDVVVMPGPDFGWPLADGDLRIGVEDVAGASPAGALWAGHGDRAAVRADSGAGPRVSRLVRQAVFLGAGSAPGGASS